MNSELIKCRICLKDDTKNSFLSIPNNQSEIAEQIFAISGITLYTASVICHECTKRLKEAIELRNDCIKADTFFKSFNERSIEILIEKRSSRNKKRFKCQACLKLFSSRYYLTQHEIATHTKMKNEQLFKCDKCGSLTKTKNLMRFHQLSSHIAKKIVDFQCRYCGRISKSSGALYAHEKTHHEIPLENYLKCQFCDKKFKEKRLLKSHIQLVHEKSLKRKCTFSQDCKFIATCSGSLNKHIKAVHLKLKNFVCDIETCEQRFCTNQQLLRHKRSHRGQKPFKCTNAQCEKFFADSHGRKKHLKICAFRDQVS